MTVARLRVLITGASRGLGLALVRHYLDRGAHVFAGARHPSHGELGPLRQTHADHLTLLPLDVTSDADRQAAVAAVHAATGALDVLINNAGQNHRGVGLGHYHAEAMLAAMHVNAVAPVLLAQAFLELLRAGAAPRVINVSTQVGSFGWNKSGTSPLYAASKAALNMYTRALAREATGVTVIAVHPGWVRTDMGGPAAPLTPDQSATHLGTLIDRLSPVDTGQFFNHDGKPHPW